MISEPRQHINYLLSTLRTHAMYLIVPAIAGLVLATLYAFFVMPETWTARQSFLIRDDLSGTAFKPGRFDSEESRKSAQETILEMARRPLVVRSVLEKLGPESMLAGDWVTDEVIEETQGVIDINAPNGAEFGKTDAIVLTAQSSSRERTRKFIELLSAEIITQTNRVRSLRFESMESESNQAYQASADARDEAIDRLNELAQRLGSDFGFLSLQGSQPTGVEAIKSEILRKQDELEKAQTIFAALLKAFDNPETASQLPSEVSIAQPKLENTMSKLLNLQEQLHLAKGLYSNKHPKVRGVAKAIEFSQQQLYKTLTGEMAGVQAGIQLKKRQIAGLKTRIEDLKTRLIRLSKARSEYTALTTQVQQLGEASTRAKTAWTEIKSRANVARTVGLLTPTDVAQVSTRPDGIGKRIIAMAGLMAGLMIGTGLIFVLAPPMAPTTTSSLANTTASQPTQAPNAETSRMPRQQIATPTGNFTAAGNSISSASFSQAASAMQTAANAMQIAATGEPEIHSQPATPTPTPAQQPIVASAPQARPTTNSPTQQPAVSQAFQQPVEAENPTAANPQTANTNRSVPLAQPAASLPRNAFLQPTNQPPRTPPLQQQKTKPFQSSKAKTVPAANVRPVDLAKSASENNEFVRVNTDTVPTSKTSKSARAIADSVSSSSASSSHQRTSASTITLSDDEKDTAMVEAGVRPSSVTEPFVLNRDGGTSQKPTSDEADAIPEQIRKLSESIMKFSKDKK